MTVDIKPITEEERRRWPISVIVELEPSFKVELGEFQPVVVEDMMSCALITLKKDTVRANHYHQTDWRYPENIAAGVVEQSSLRLGLDVVRVLDRCRHALERAR